jgi:hypothetical protein
MEVTTSTWLLLGSAILIVRGCIGMTDLMLASLKGKDVGAKKQVPNSAPETPVRCKFGDKSSSSSRHSSSSGRAERWIAAQRAWVKAANEPADGKDRSVEAGS